MHIVDGSLSSVVGTRCIPLSSFLPLSFMFHVFNFKLNLVSISYITKVLNCSVTFFHLSFVFQDLKMGKIIGKGHENLGLYFMDDGSFIICASISYITKALNCSLFSFLSIVFCRT